MATMTIKNIPDDLYRWLKQQAAEHRRSINQEAIVCLEQLRGGGKIDPERFLEELDELHAGMGKVWLTDDDIDAFINEGRP